MNKVKLRAMTQPEEDSGIPDASGLIAYCARVSNPDNQGNYETAPRLIDYLIKNAHWSPLEMVNLVFEIDCPRDIARQILRHRSFSFQEFCVSGDTEVHFALPGKLKKGLYSPTRKMKISELYDKFHNGAAPIPHKSSGNPVRIPMKERIKNMQIKMYDEETGKLSTSHIVDVFDTGIKPVYKITLENGKVIKATKEHKFLGRNGFASLEDLVGLKMINNKAVCTVKDVELATNGEPVYQNYDWLKEAKEESLNSSGVKYIAEKAGVSYHTIRKWLKIHNLCFTKKEVSKYTKTWNKGFFGYRNRPHSFETRQKMRESALARGVSHNWYRGGGSKKREPLNSVDVAKFRKECGDKCNRCGETNNLHIHHVIPVSENAEMQHDISNWELLCSTCHRNHHKAEDMPGWQKLGAKVRKEKNQVPKWSKIKYVEYVGEEQTYDLQIENSSHNYVANGIITHNSQRYAETTQLGMTTREFRLQDQKNRQNSIEMEDEELKNQWEAKQQQIQHEIVMAYKWALENNMAKECARVILPEGMQMTRMTMNGTLRSWLHYLDLRQANGTQKEHTEIAMLMKPIIAKKIPIVSKWINRT